MSINRITSLTEQITDLDIKNLEGKILTIVEGIGLPSRQEDAIKSQVRNVLWDKWAEVIDRTVIYYDGYVYEIESDGRWKKASKIVAEKEIV